MGHATMIRTAVVVYLMVVAPYVYASDGTEGTTLPDAPSTVMVRQQFVESTQQRKPLVVVPPEQEYVPLTSHEKFQNYLHVAKSPYTFGKTAVDAAVSHLRSGGEHYGDGWSGYGKRYGVSLAARETSMFVGGYFFPTVLHQDPRFFYSNKTSVKGRALDAASRVLFTKHDSGKTVFNTSYMFSNVVNSSLGNVWDLHREHSVQNTLGVIGYNYVSDAIGNIWREFWPDIHKKVHHREPGPVQAVERKMKQWNPKKGRYEYPKKDVD